MNLKGGQNTWEQKNAEILHEYRNTKHSVTQIAPAMVFLDRYVRGGIIPLANLTMTQSEAKRVRDTNQKSYNQKLQLKNKKGKHFAEGDWVKVKCPPNVTNRKYGKPIQISKQIGPYTYLLTDGRKRNQRCLVAVFGMSDDCRTSKEKCCSSSAEEESCSRRVIILEEESRSAANLADSATNLSV